MLAKGSLTIGWLRGIPIRLHFSLLLILPYLAWGIARETPLLARTARVPFEALLLPPWATGSILAVSLFACILLHELGHVAVGRATGARFGAITLMLLGGVSEMSELPRRPIAEAAMAIAGPLVSLAIAGLCALASQASLPVDARLATFYLAWVNVALAVFNLLPAFPLDGGRVLRALLAGVTTRLRATRIAAAVGQVLAALLALFGFISGNWVLVLIAVMIALGAQAELQALRRQQRQQASDEPDAPPPPDDRPL